MRRLLDRLNLTGAVMTPREFVKARLKQLKKTQKSLADAMGMREAALSLLLSGKRTMTAHEAANLSHHLDLDIYDILEAFNLPASRRPRPIFLDGEIRDDGITPYLQDRPQVPAPVGVVFTGAYLVATDTLKPRYLRGEVLFTDAADTHPAAHVGAECVLSTPAGRRFGRLLRAENGTYTVAEADGSVAFGVPVTAAEPVVWHRPAVLD